MIEGHYENAAGLAAAVDGPDASAEMLRFFAGHSLPPDLMPLARRSNAFLGA